MGLVEGLKLKRKSLSRKLKIFQRRVKNSAAAFRVGESAYTLAIAPIGRFEVAYRRGTTDDDQLRHSFDNDAFFAEVPEYVAGPGDTILDVGAHIGTFALLASSKVPNGHVYTVEPSEENFNLLRINLTLNKCENVTPQRIALSDRDGVVTLYHREWNLGHSITRPTMHGEEVPTTTLQGFFDLHNIEKVDFAKFNCEGAEFPIILSTRREQLRKITIILVLYHEDLAASHNHRQLMAHLSACGFDTRLTRQKNARGWIIARRK
jgi:FkbM family methyltransferase